ncbi:metallophosphoesterase family protein [Candidatus Micrarchaeota archaeon]|nr:metallophosphoesterase family protein [Candidatus Micrarchaeota archaeon]
MKPKPKLLILGDFHPATREKTLELERKARAVIEQENPTHVICTGDFDHPDMVLAWKKIAEELEKKGVIVVTVPGNHDHANVTEERIVSPTLYQQNFGDNKSLQQEFEKNPKARDYVNSLLKTKVRALTFGKTRVVIAHGAFDGSLRSYPNAREEIQRLWFRLGGSLDHRANFEQLVKAKCGLFLRGHDHEPEHASYDPADETSQSIKINKPGFRGKTFELPKDRFHTITAGAFYDGNYAVLTRERGGLKVTFKKTK